MFYKTALCFPSMECLIFCFHIVYTFQLLTVDLISATASSFIFSNTIERDDEMNEGKEKIVLISKSFTTILFIFFGTLLCRSIIVIGSLGSSKFIKFKQNSDSENNNGNLIANEEDTGTLVYRVQYPLFTHRKWFPYSMFNFFLNTTREYI